MEKSLEYPEPWRSILAVGDLLVERVIKNRMITLISRGACNPTGWNRAPVRLANKLAGPDSPFSVHYSPMHPEVIIVVSGGPNESHLTTHNAHQMIGPGVEVKHVVGENHSDIPFYVGCEDVVRSSETWICPNI